MANPVSKGIGTGAAQVYDYSRIDNAMNNAFQMISNKQERADQAEAAKEAAKKKAEAKLRGDWKFDSSKVKDADKDVIIEMVNSGFNDLDGHWEDIMNGDPEWTNKFNSLSMGIKNYISSSADTKVFEDNFLKDINKPDSGYSDAKKEDLMNGIASPGNFMSKYNETGLINRDQVVGNSFTKVDKVFLDNTDSLYDTVDTSYENAQGVLSSVKKKTWKDDSVAFPKFMTTVENTPELMNDIRIQYGNPGEDVTEDQIRQFYNDYKASRINEWKKTAGREAQDEKTVGKPDRFKTIFTPYKEDKGYPGFKMTRSGGKLVPINITTPAEGDKPEADFDILPSTVFKTPDGWRIKGYKVKDVWDAEKGEEVAVKGDQVNLPVTPNMLASIQGQYGLEGDLNSLLKQDEGDQKEGKEDKTITRSDLTSQAKKSGYSEDEYRKLLEEKGYTITK